MTKDIFPGRLQVLDDPVADLLDDLAALSQHWARNRERGRMPHSVRAAMLLVARDALAAADAKPTMAAAAGVDVFCQKCGCYHKPGHNSLCAA